MDSAAVAAYKPVPLLPLLRLGRWQQICGGTQPTGTHAENPLFSVCLHMLLKFRAGLGADYISAAYYTDAQPLGNTQPPIHAKMQSGDFVYESHNSLCVLPAVLPELLVETPCRLLAAV
jgi:hypothetical protein